MKIWQPIRERILRVAEWLRDWWAFCHTVRVGATLAALLLCVWAAHAPEGGGLALQYERIVSPTGIHGIRFFAHHPVSERWSFKATLDLSDPTDRFNLINYSDEDGLLQASLYGNIPQIYVYAIRRFPR